jgi:carbon storage regulator CsrA
MLVLTRKLQEKIHIGDNVTITVVRIKGNTVRVGIEAPEGVRVIRGEVLQRDSALASGEREASSVEQPEAAGAEADDDIAPPAAGGRPVGLGRRPLRREELFRRAAASMAVTKHAV